MKSKAEILEIYKDGIKTLNELNRNKVYSSCKSGEKEIEKDRITRDKILVELNLLEVLLELKPWFDIPYK